MTTDTRRRAWLKYGLPPDLRRDAQRLAKRLHRLRKAGVTTHRVAVAWADHTTHHAGMAAMQKVWEVALIYTAQDRAPWKGSHITCKSDFNKTIHQGMQFTLP